MIDIPAFLASGETFSVVRTSCLTFLRHAPPESIDSFITDPPYGIKLALKWNRTRPRSIRGDGKLEARKLWQDWIPLAYEAAKPNTAHAVFGSWKSPWMHELLAQRFRVVGCICWDKRQIGLGWYLRPRWEMIYIVHKGKPPQPSPAPHDIWQFQRQYRPLHPCQKPIPLMQRLVELLAPPGGVVCDLFSGVASTGVGAINAGRRFIGVEIDQRFARLGSGRCGLAVKERGE